MNKKQIGTAEVIAGMGLVMLGHKAKGLALFGHGIHGLEQAYRYSHPHLAPGLKARWQESVTFYDATHQDETNRTLHRWGIPVILGGALGLLAARPYRLPWVLAAVAFGGGWVLNILGHGKYERNRPAFTEDPLSFIAGPVWDVKQWLAQARAARGTVGAKHV